MGELTAPEQQVFDIMDTIHDSGYHFRMVVVVKGDILETTAALGPVLKVTQSPSTGANLLTLANEDQSFEFHLQLSEVSKIVLLEKPTPSKTLRIVRILNAAGESMSSLILADESQEAVTWFEQGLIATFGTEIQL
jgi:putative heme iron utilization protein